MRILNILFCGMILMLVTSCASVPLSTMWELKNFDLASTDARQLRVGVKMPNFIKIRTGDIRFVVKMINKDSSVRVERKLQLLAITDGVELTGLKKYQNPGFRIYVFKLTKESLVTWQNFKIRFNALKKEFGDDVSGQLSINTKGCEMPGTRNRAVLVTTFFKSAETKEFVVLSSQQDIGGMLRKTKAVKLCPVESAG